MTLPGVMIEHGPADWQIIQRDENNQGSLTLRGTWSTGETEFSIQARLVDENTQMPVTRELDWQDATLDVAATKYSLTLKNIPAGGFIPGLGDPGFAARPRMTNAPCGAITSTTSASATCT